MTTSAATLRYLLLAALLATPRVWAQPNSAQAAPVPPAVQSAKSIFVSNAGSDSGLFPEPFSDGPNRTYDEFYADMKSSGQFQLVNDPAQADLVAEVRLIAPYGPTNANKQNGTADPRPMFRLVIYERKTHFILWTCTQSIGLAFLQKTHDHNFDEALGNLVDDFLRVAGKPVVASH